MIKFIEDHGGMFGLLSLLVALALGYSALRRNAMADVKEELDDPKHRADLLAHRDDPRGRVYQTALDRLTGWADRFYGPRKLSFRAFGRCLTLAFVYPVLAALIAWVWANVHSPGGLAFFADQPVLLDRLWRAVMLVAATMATGAYYANTKRIQSVVHAFLTKCLFGSTPEKGTRGGAFSSVVSWLIVVVGVGVVGASVAVVIIAGVGVVVGAVVVVVVMVGVIVGVGVGVSFASVVSVAGVIGLGVGVGVVVGAAGVILQYDQDAAALYLLFFALLPVLNALADTVSVAATRTFLDRAKTPQRPLPAILALLCVDLIVGAICLIGLLALLTHSLDLWQTWSPGTVPLDWRTYWAGALERPAEGIALWLMVATTLAPTALHCLLGLAAVLTHGSRRRLQALDGLSADAAPSPAERTRIAKKLVGARVYGLVLGFVIVALCLWGLWLGVGKVFPLVPDSLLDAIFPDATQSGNAGL